MDVMHYTIQQLHSDIMTRFTHSIASCTAYSTHILVYVHIQYVYVYLPCSHNFSRVIGTLAHQCECSLLYMCIQYRVMYTNTHVVVDLYNSSAYPCNTDCTHCTIHSVMDIKHLYCLKAKVSS